MTTYSEWIIISKDRKCDLPHDAKVQVMWRDDSVEYVEHNISPTSVLVHCAHIDRWDKDLFAYRVVQEPVGEVREYPCNARFFKELTPTFLLNDCDSRAVEGTATQTTRDGRPYRFVWQAE